ncbi:MULTISPECIES: peptidoglycan-binding domain-containing protein [Mesorhizobium]|uniref:Peptidoglycan-binding protein n=1 Tax=Mesorhizobium denitrificans TaxID=2294114 RepID=A0A371XHS8_9HYPH|nr:MULTISPECIES: peptidoglycan-binding domain-containing protein [Mesorhizobium]RFC68772.1 peptidoglycan-binding protein [Mesorhizobium denitrificans]
MARSAKPRKKRAAAPHDGVVVQGMQAVGSFMSNNPALVGGTTAFLIALSFVSANALWYQPHAHTSPLFSTRSFDSFVVSSRNQTNEPETTIRLERPETPLPQARPADVPRSVPKGDAQLQSVQAVLKQLGYYQGDVDGLAGPNTSAAISAYQQKMGFTVSGHVDEKLLKELGIADITGSIEPPAPAPDATALLARIQTGLKAFGNEGIDADGRMGAKTRAGIKEFQALFGLPQTGEPDEAVYRKMKAEHLID